MANVDQLPPQGSPRIGRYHEYESFVSFDGEIHVLGIIVTILFLNRTKPQSLKTKSHKNRKQSVHFMDTALRGTFNPNCWNGSGRRCEGSGWGQGGIGWRGELRAKSYLKDKSRRKLILKGNGRDALQVPDVGVQACQSLSWATRLSRNKASLQWDHLNLRWLGDIQVEMPVGGCIYETLEVKRENQTRDQDFNMVLSHWRNGQN